MSLTLRGRRVSFDWLKPPPSSPDGTMALVDHLRELRYRLTIALIAIVLASILSAVFYQRLYAVLLYPYNLARQYLAEDNPGISTEIVNIGVPAPFVLAIKICVVAGLLLSSPVWIYQIWAFIVPALLAQEKKWALLFIGSATPLFLGGVAMGYWIMPRAISVMLGFTPEGQEVTNMIDLPDFLNLLIQLMLVFGVAFLLPIVVLALNLLGVVKAKQLAQARTFIIFGTFVVGAVATPTTDPFSMLALALPMSLLYLIAEAVCHVNDRRRARRQLEAEASEATPEITS
ncbi:twin-arginine translocase subunit TatC [Auraticoccus sp. F435]|uniref:Sec-independent protein translocase protein TatC n=1 Tax=Auraticoccus cholistanensis TaxID=2656650 RepID=A0A6A9US43_9ACTN|nr:twin-arginine translocase subunit TatC [Auraticoccus cholistanensis]MVA75613.1 twin-arginine translocase subunit TatC [Auraticoccus cholistanensis]